MLRSVYCYLYYNCTRRGQSCGGGCRRDSLFESLASCWNVNLTQKMYLWHTHTYINKYYQYRTSYTHTQIPTHTILIRTTTTIIHHSIIAPVTGVVLRGGVRVLLHSAHQQRSQPHHLLQLQQRPAQRLGSTANVQTQQAWLFLPAQSVLYVQCYSYLTNCNAPRVEPDIDSTPPTSAVSTLRPCMWYRR